MRGEVNRRLVAYVSPETDPRAVAEMLRLILSGMSAEGRLPEVLPPVTKRETPPVEDRRAVRRRAREARLEAEEIAGKE
jgi:hypothetical protein